MGLFHRLFWLADQAFGWLTYFWPITLPLLLLLILAAAANWPFTSLRFRPAYLLILSPLVISLLVLLCGAIFEHNSNAPIGIPAWPGCLIYGLFIGQLALAIAIIIRLRGLRFFAIAIMLWQLWITVACGLVAGIAVSGDSL